MLAGRIAVITGASSGIGAETAVAFAAAGASVILTARREKQLEAVRNRIAAAGRAVIAVPADVTSLADRTRIVSSAIERFGTIDILVNCAGRGGRGAVESTPLDAVRAMFDVNVFGPLALTQAIAAIMRTRGMGRIVNVTSVSGRIARPFSGVYDASKHALEAFSDALRQELAPFGVTVVVVRPGYVHDTGFGEAADREVSHADAYEETFVAYRKGGRLRRHFAAHPADVAATILRAAASASPRARYAVPLFASFQLLLRRLLPDGFFDRHIANM